MARWEFILTDISGTVHGELTQASTRKVSDPWMRVPTASCSIPIWHPLADTALTTDCLLKCYRTDTNTGVKTLVHHGVVVGAEEQAGEGAQTVGISSVGPFWRLSKRLIGTTRSGQGFGTVAAPLDLSAIGRNIVDTANGQGYTGITTSTTAGSGATTTNCGQTASTGAWWLKVAAEGIAELAAGLNSFEFRVRPVEPSNPLGIFPRMALIDFGPETSFNTIRADAIFEYGTPRANVSSYTRQISREQMVNKAWISVSGWPDAPVQYGSPLVTQDIRSRTNAASVAARGLYEEVVPDGGVIYAPLRDQIADFHLRYRANYKQVVTFRPALNATPAPYTDYFCGEQVRARAVVNGSQRFDALFRVYGITFDIDKNGSETVELELIEP